MPTKLYLILAFATIAVKSNAQNVGIGTTTPKARLHVTDSSVLFSAEGVLPGGIPAPPPAQGTGRRMMWYPQKAAFRAGLVSTSNWDKDSIGNISFATGANTKASGPVSFAAGQQTSATGLYSTSFGFNTLASGSYSTALGISNIASGVSTTAMGSGNKASGEQAVVFGISNSAVGNNSIAGGRLSIAGAESSMAMGTYTKSLSQSSMVVGMYNDTSNNNRLFEVGNGSADNARTNAVTVLTNGNTGMGTTTPKARLHVADSNVVFSAADPLLAVPGNTPISGAGARMMWYSGKAAFRTGFIDGTQWDKNNVGFYFFASGYSTTANNLYSTALGRNTLASGTSSTSLGYFTIASGSNSTALGASSQATGNEATALNSNTIASGFAATAMGFATMAKGDVSVAMGNYTKSRSANSLVVGSFNDTTNTNRLLEIGNGTGDNARANAMTILQNGHTGIGTVNPVARLHVADSNVLFTGPATLTGTTTFNPPASGAGTRMMWYPQKAAFRVGTVNNDNWDKDSIGFFSFASGSNTKAIGRVSTCFGSSTVASGVYAVSMGAYSVASGFISISMGNGTSASGDNATSLGVGTVASGNASIAMGYESVASGGASISMGRRTVASGLASLVTGDGTFAKARGSFTTGSFNDNSDLPEPYIEAASDRIFQIGNGIFDARSNALTVLRNGKTGIGTINPTKQLEVIGLASATPVTLVIGNRGGFGPAALEFVSDYGLASQWRPGYIRNNDLGGFTGSSEFYTNGTGSGNLYGNVKGFEVRNGAALTATGSVGSYSDARLKNNTTAFTDGLNVITKIKPVQFYYNKDAPFPTDKQQTGIIAQELEMIAPYMIEKNNQNGYADLRTVNSQAFTYLLINAVKEQQLQIERLQVEMSELKELIKRFVEKE